MSLVDVFEKKTAALLDFLRVVLQKMLRFITGSIVFV
jgi:hypothetical protein